MTGSDFRRWLYRGQRSNWIARMLNRAWAVVVSSGAASNLYVTLEVTGRKSGRTVSLPVVVAVVDGRRYLVSMLGEHMQWVHNVRAAGGRAVLKRGGCEEVHLEEVPANQRALILKAYLQRAPGARPHVPVNKEAPLAEFDKVAAPRTFTFEQTHAFTEQVEQAARESVCLISPQVDIDIVVHVEPLASPTETVAEQIHYLAEAQGVHAHAIHIREVSGHLETDFDSESGRDLPVSRTRGPPASIG